MPQLSLPPTLSRALQRAAWLGALVLLLPGWLYYTTRTRIHTFDAVSYMWNVEAKPYGELFHPHHLLYAPLGQAAYRFAVSLGYAGHSDTPIQAVNAIAGALGLIFFWRFGTHLAQHAGVALGVALLIGACYAYWLYAAEVEVYTLSTAFLCLALWALILLDERPHPLWAAALGVAHGAALMFHQTNALFSIPLGVFLLLRPGLRRLSILLAYALALGLTVLIPYGVVIFNSGFRDWKSVYDWLTAYAQTGRWGGFLALKHLPALWAGMSNAVSVTPALAVVFYLLAAIGLARGVFRARTDSHYRPWLAFGLAWLVVYGAFFWWWEPWNIEFWIATLPLMGFWILNASPSPVALATGEGRGGGFRHPSLVTLAGLLPFALAGLLYWNHLAPIRRVGDPNNDYYYRMTEALQTILQPSDLVLTRGNILDIYLPFYANHPATLSMRDLDFRFGGDRAQLMSNLFAQLEWAHVTGQAVVIDQLILDEPRDADRNPFGLLPEEIAALKERYPLSPLVALDGYTIFSGTPRFDNPDATAWAFAADLQGWNAWGMDQPRFERAGWCFTGGADPQLKGPVIRADASKFAHLELDLTLNADQSETQIFWRAPEGAFSLDNSAVVPLQRGRQTYSVSLAGAPGWERIIGQLRVDPIPGAEGQSAPVTVCVHGVRLLP